MPLDPAAVRDQAIRDQHRQAGCPRHLLDRLVLREPDACHYGLLRALVVDDRLTLGIDERDFAQPGIDACRRPQLARRRENEMVGLQHVGIEIVERHAFYVVRQFLEAGIDDVILHGTRRSRMRSLKSVPARFGRNRATSRPAAYQRIRQVSALCWPLAS